MGHNKDCKLPGHCNYCRPISIGNGGMDTISGKFSDRSPGCQLSASKISVMDVHDLDKGATASEGKCVRGPNQGCKNSLNDTIFILYYLFSLFGGLHIY